ncbi:cyclomaltodextrinase, putative [Entamoeba invadens IP1]|uniref:Cyclomaltodextrinase, putative n=1 Tax=Entamoeba invadens IP1 TaxID=370355 RepID=A0A0A1U4P9_ENTIV|nr:cyclomaltodextrinase, putative [Entamoeba invadens IP1]ELP89179.1 cyclomaltodextrinase, putative [Entamoeba invadens IP1]|eukprot:XP_004255950.1 cyclomaltodextrinase, putative [Entamoeba invadens IP1]
MFISFSLLLLLVSSFDTSKFRGLTVYQIFVSTFSDGDASGFQNGWGSTSTTFSGNLQGIITKLPYISNLGFNAIWMTPIFDQGYNNSQSSINSNCKNHPSTGYFSNDYFSIDPHFGTTTDFQNLVKTAHENGLFVILDGVFGHWKYPECLSDIKASPNNKKPVALASTKNVADYTKKDTLDFFVEVAKYWIKNFDIDGWRLDVANEISYTVGGVTTNMLSYIRDAVHEAAEENKKLNKKWGTLGYIVGEVWKGGIDDLLKYYGTSVDDSVDSFFDFPGYYDMIKVVAQTADKETSSTASNIFTSINRVYEKKYENWMFPNLMIGNHDLPRIGNLVRNRWNVAQDTDKYFEALRMAFGTQAIFPGPITVYYGEETGDILECWNQSGDCGAAKDNCGRTNFVKTFIQRAQDERAIVERVIKFRTTHPSMYSINAESTVTPYSNSASLYARKYLGDDDWNKNVIMAINMKSTAVEFDVGTFACLRNLFTNQTMKVDKKITLQAFSSALFVDCDPKQSSESGVSTSWVMFFVALIMLTI